MPRRARLVALLLLAFGVTSSPDLVTPAAAGSREDECQDLSRRAVTLLGEAERASDARKAIEAATMLERAMRLCPENLELPFQRALALCVARDEDAARAALRSLDEQLVARGTDPEKDPRSLYVRALVHFTFGNNAAACLDVLRVLEARAPQFLPAAVANLRFRAHLDYANQLAFGRAFHDAIKHAQLAVEVARGNERRTDLARRNLGQIYRMADRWIESQTEFEDLVRKYPQDAVLRYALASVLADQLKFEEACAQWTEVLRLRTLPGSVDPREADQLADAPLRYGVSLVHALRVPDGLGRIRAYVKENPSDVRGWVHLGVTLLDNADPSDPAGAAEALEKALTLDPLCERTLRRLVEIYTGPKPDAARAKELQAILDDPKAKARREAEMDRRKKVRPDRTTGCE